MNHKNVLSLILVSSLLLSSYSAIITKASLTWSNQTVDSSDSKVGTWSSLAFDSKGNPHISYFDITSENLKYANWTGSEWVIYIVDEIGSVGLYSSLELDQNDKPCISYGKQNQGELRYAKWTGSSWIIQTVESKISVGLYSSLELDSNNNPCISYYDSFLQDLKYAKWTGSAWAIQTVDSAGKVGEYTSLALDKNDNPCISYYDETNGDLKYAKWSGSAWSYQTVDSTGDVGLDTSLALDSNDNPYIGYMDLTNFNLKYAKWSGAVWSIQTVEKLSGARSRNISLALDQTGKPCISYNDEYFSDLNLARWNGTAWTIQAVGHIGGQGGKSSLAINKDGNPCISYMDDAKYDLIYATLTQSTTNLKVTIKDEAGAAILGADVGTTTMPSGQTGLKDKSGNDGSVTFINVKPGNYVVKAEMSGYQDATSIVTVTSLKTAEVTLILKKAQTITSLKVTVKDEAGKPVSGASVGTTAQPSSQTSLKVNSDSDGIVLFSNIKPGSYTIKADKNGYQPATSTISVAALSTTEITLTLKTTPTKGDIKVTVKDKDGKPILGVSISSTTQPSGQQTLNGVTSANGEISFSEVLPGGYTIQASKSGYTTASAQNTVMAGSSTTINITLQDETSTGGGIPGFPIEAMLIGAMLSVAQILFKEKPSRTRCYIQ